MEDKKDKFQPPVLVKKNMFGAPVPIFSLDTEDIGQSVDVPFARWVGLIRSRWASFNAWIVFSEPITGLEFTDFQILNESGVVQTDWTSNNISGSFSTTRSNQSIPIGLIAPADTDGNFRIRLLANSVRTGGSSTDNAPANSITSPLFYINGSVIIRFGFARGRTASQAWIQGSLQSQYQGITGITSSDFEVINDSNQVQTGWSITASASSIARNRNTQPFAVAPSGTNGLFRLRLKANSLQVTGTSITAPPTDLVSYLVPINNTGNPNAGVGLNFGSVGYSRTVGNALSVGVSVYGPTQISGITSSDFEVINDSNQIQSGWTITVTRIFIFQVEGSISLTVRPPNGITGNFAVRMKANSGNFSGVTAPPNPITSQFVAIDTRIYFSNASTRTGDLTIRVNSTVEVTGINKSDFRFGDGTTVNYPIVQESNFVNTKISSNRIPAGGYITLSVFPLSAVIGSVQVKSNSMRLSGSLTDNIPLANTFVVTNNLEYLVKWFDWSNLEGGTTLSVTLSQVRGSISPRGTNYFRVLNSSETVQSGWTIAINRSGGNATVIATPPANTQGEFYLELLANGISVSSRTYPAANTLTSYPVVVDNVRTLPTAIWGTLTGTGVITSSITFTGAAITDLTIADFEVLDSDDIPQYGWTISINPTGSTVASGGSVAITGTPPVGSTASGDFKLRLKPASVRSGGSTVNNFPTNGIGISSAEYEVDTRTAITVTSFSRPTGTDADRTRTYTLVFGQSVPSSELTTSDFTLTDTRTTGNGTVNISSVTPTSGSQTTYSVVISISSNISGSYTLALNADAITAQETDPYQSGPSDAYTATPTPTTYNVPAIVATAAWSGVSYTGGKLTGTLTFSGANITGITRDDFEVLNTSDVAQSGWTFDLPSATATDDIGIRISATPPAGQNASFKLSLEATSVRSDGSTTDNAPAAAVNSDAIAVDNRQALRVTGFTAPSGTQTGSTSTFRLTFGSVIPTDQLTGSDFTFSSGTGFSSITPTYTDGPTNTMARVFDIAVNNPTVQNGTYRIMLKADSIPDGTTYLEGPSAVSNSELVTYDTRPRVSVTRFTAPSGTQTGSTADFTLVLDRSVPASQLTAADFTVSNTNASINSITPTTGSQATYTVKVDQPSSGSGTYSVTLLADAIDSTTSYVGGPANDYTSTSVTFNTRTIASAAWSSVSYTSGKLQGTITFSGATITGLETGDFEILDSSDAVQTGWTFELPTGITDSSSITSGTGTLIRATPPANRNASYKLRLKATSVMSDGSTTDNAPSTVATTNAVAIDNRPALTVDSFNAPTGTQSGSTSTFVLTFSTAVLKTQVENNDFAPETGASIASVTGRGAATTATIFDVVVNNPTNTQGSYRIALNANAVNASTTHQRGPASTSTSTQVAYDTRPSVNVTSFSRPTGTDADRTRTYMLVLSQNVPATQLTSSDFTLTDSRLTGSARGAITISSITPTSGSQTTYSVVVSLPSGISGSYTLALKANAISGTSTTVYRSGPTAAYTATPSPTTYNVTHHIATAGWTGVTFTGGKLQGTLTFRNPSGVTAQITNIEQTDFAVVNSSGTVQSGWMFDTPSSTATSGTGITIAATPPANQNAQYALRLNATSVRSDGSNANNTPATAETSSTTLVDNRPQLTVSTFTAPTGIQTGATSVFTLTFNVAIPVTQITASDFNIPSNTSITLIASSTAINSRIFQITVTNPARLSGTYSIALQRNAVDGSTTYKGGPTAIETSGTVNYNTVPYAYWPATPATPAGDRSVSLILTISEDPGAAFSATDDFEVQLRSGSSPNYVYTTQSAVDWPITSTGTGTIRTIKASPTNLVAAGTYRLVLKEDAFGTNKPEADVPSLAFTIGNVPIVATASWSNITGGRTLSGRCIFNGASVAGITGSDFSVITTGNIVDPDWTISVSSDTATDGGFVSVIATPVNQIAGIDYFLRINELSVDSDGGSNNAPATDITSADSATVNNTIADLIIAIPTWSNIVGGRSLSGTLTFTGAPVEEIEDTDIEVLNALNTVDSDFTITISGSSVVSGGNVTVMATSALPKNGFFKFRLKANSVKSDGSSVNNSPESELISISIPVNNTDTLSGRSSYTVTIPIPQGNEGAIQLSLRQRSFNVLGNDNQIGPEFQQYLGTIFYNTETIPQIINIERPDVLVGNGAENEVLIDFNTEVQGLSFGDFLLEGMDPLPVFGNSNIKYGVTQDPDISLPAADRDQDLVAGVTRAKYYKLIFTFPDAVPVGKLDIYLRDMAVNND